MGEAELHGQMKAPVCLSWPGVLPPGDFLCSQTVSIEFRLKPNGSMAQGDKGDRAEKAECPEVLALYYHLILIYTHNA